jgi:hypothetical protein
MSMCYDHMWPSCKRPTKWTPTDIIIRCLNLLNKGFSHKTVQRVCGVSNTVTIGCRLIDDHPEWKQKVLSGEIDITEAADRIKGWYHNLGARPPHM